VSTARVHGPARVHGRVRGPAREHGPCTRAVFRDAAWVVDSGGPKEACVTLGRIGATWRIRLNHPSAAAMRPYVKLLRLLVITVVVVVVVPTPLHGSGCKLEEW